MNHVNFEERGRIKGIKVLLAELEAVAGAKDLVQKLRNELNIYMGNRYLDELDERKVAAA